MWNESVVKGQFEKKFEPLASELYLAGKFGLESTLAPEKAQHVAEVMQSMYRLLDLYEAKNEIDRVLRRYLIRAGLVLDAFALLVWLL